MVSSFQHLQLECAIRARRPYISAERPVGVDAAQQGVWKQPVYKAHLDKGQLGGTAQNRGARRDGAGRPIGNAERQHKSL